MRLARERTVVMRWMKLSKGDDAQPSSADGEHSSASSLELLALALEQLGDTRGRDAITSVCLDFAVRIAGCAGLLLVPRAQTESILLRARPTDRTALREYAVRVAAEARRRTEIVGAEGAAFSSLTIPASSDRFEAVVFLWTGSYPLTAEKTSALRALANAFATAMRLERAVEDSARSYAHFRSEVEDLKHRLRNILAFIRSIVRRTMQSSQTSEEFALHLESRIGAVSRIQATLHSVGGTGVELQDLIRGELVANAIDESRVSIAGPAVRLRARAAETVALAIHELTTNSLKYGAFATGTGRAQIDWTVVRGTRDLPWLQMIWLERDVAIATSAPRHRGFGTELIERTVHYELGGTGRLTFTPGGIECRIEVPLNPQNSSSIHSQQRSGSV